MTWTLTKIIGFVRKTRQFHGQVYVDYNLFVRKRFNTDKSLNINKLLRKTWRFSGEVW